MAPVAPFFLSLLAIAGVVEAGPLQPGRHMAPAVYNQGLAGHARRGLGKVLNRYYGDSQGLSPPPPLVQKRANNVAPGWTALGCKSESNGQRLLAGSSFTSNSMTPLLCMNQCQKLGFTYAATEWVDECYCGNSFIGSGGAAQPDATCSTPCKGDATQMCGAAWFLNVYQYTASSAACNSTTVPVTPSPTTSKTTAAIPTSTVPTYNNTVDHSEWYAHGCAVDSNPRVLTEFSNLAMAGMTVDSCLTLCEDKGFAFAGVEFKNQCFCGSKLPVNVTYADICQLPCEGNSKETCGGYWAMEVYELVSSTDCPVTTATSIGNNLVAQPSATTLKPITAPTTTPATVKPSTTTAAAPAVTTAPIPASSGDHQVWAHHMVGNAYPYTQANWAIDIRAAYNQAIDGFALNLGSEGWQVDRAADAYAAAQNSGLNFKLFLSLDVTALGCWSGGDATNLVNIVQRFAKHPNQAMHNGKVLVSTFAGSDCNFGTGQGSSAWQSMFVDALRNQGTNIFFMPSIFSDVSTFGGNSWMDGELNWNSAWPVGNNQISTDTDYRYMNALGGKEYMAAVSPFFFTHFGADLWNKNWLYRADDWMYCTRWEQLIAMRNQVKQIEILTWNDYGESSYIGPVQGALPGYSNRWVDGFDHQGLGALTSYYSTAYKTGQYPAITKDTLIIWSRPHAHDANSNDYIGKPTGWDWTTDYMWAVVLATSDASVTLTSGSNTQTFNVKAGLNKLKIANSPGAMSGKISRNGGDVATVTMNGQYTLTPSSYNYNYYVGSS